MALFQGAIARPTIDEITQKMNVVQSALNTMASAGLMLPSNPNNDSAGDLPRDLTLLDDEALGDLLGKISAYTGFVDAQLALYSVQKQSAEATLDSVSATVRLEIRHNQAAMSKGKLHTKDKDDLVLTDQRFIDAKSNALYWESLYVLTRTVLNKAQRNWDTVSRRITQRGQEVERSKREVNVGAIRSPFRR